VPYVWGGESRREGGFDCSGLIWAAYKAAGIPVARTTGGMLQQGRRVDPQHLLPGDLVFSSPGHVALYVGNGKVIVAPHTGAQVRLEDMSALGSFYQARRIAPQAAYSGVSTTHPDVAAQRFGQLTASQASRGGVTSLLAFLPKAQPLQLNLTPTQPQAGPAPAVTAQALSAGVQAPPTPTRPQTGLPAAVDVSPELHSLDSLRRKLLAS
jgi:hypothetical protein